MSISPVNPTSVASRLVVEHLTVSTSRSGDPVIRDVSITARSGEVLGLVGESGCGKTTLGLAMLGYVRRGLRLSAGRVLLDGQDLRDLSAERLRSLRGSQLAYVPQDPATALNPVRRIGPQVREVLSYHGYSSGQMSARIDELLAEVGLDLVPRAMQAYPHQLSGGQQQRAAIAMAFACRPSLIVLDEPTTGLDVTTQRTILKTISELCSRYGVAAVYVSHDVAVVGEIADRVAVMYAGRLVEIGGTDRVFAEPRHPYTQGLLRAVPSPNQALHLVGMEGTPPRPESRPEGCSFAPRCGLVADRCRREVPELLAAPTMAHQAACFFSDAVTSSLPLGLATPSPPARGDATDVVDTSALLAISGLEASYGNSKVLHDVTMSVTRGSCVAVVGESGSGKSTLARCIAGLHESWSGEITLDGRGLTPGIRQRSSGQLQRLQYIFQNPYASLNPRRSIGSLVAQPIDHFSRESRERRDAAVAAALRAVSLPVELSAFYPDQISGGERQRVAIARAVAVGPSLLICDEVTSALDVSVQALVVEMLRQLQREQHLSLLFITHNLALVRSIAQHVVVMQDGRIVEEGPVGAVLDHPQADYTKRLLLDAPQLEMR